MSENVEFLKTNALFKNASPQFLKDVSAAISVKRFDKNFVFFINSDEAQSFYFIKQGWVKLFRETLDGSQAIVDICTGGHIFGETAIFENNQYPYSAEAVEPCEIATIPLDLLKTEIETNNKFALDMMGSMARYRRQQDREIEHRALQNAPQRIGCFLLRLADQTADGGVTIQLPYDKMLVASRLGMQPETFSRALNKLKEKTGMEIKGGTIKLDDLEKLTDFSCSACSSSFPCNDLQSCK